MANDVTIKKFTIGSTQYQVDYNGLANTPNIPEDKSAEIIALQQQVAELMPKKAVFTLDDNISEVYVLDYETQISDDQRKWVEDELSFVYARNGEFGYPCIDGSGQVNFKPVLASDYDIINATVGGTYKNFKTPYTTCKDGLYRFTKATTDLSITLAAAKESEMTGWVVTYNLVLPEDFSGQAPTVTVYRTEEAAINDYKGVELSFINSVATDKAYSTETGYPSNAEASTKLAQAHVVVTNIPEGYVVTATKSGTINAMKVIDGLDNAWNATKVGADDGVIIITMTAEA